MENTSTEIELNRQLLLYNEQRIRNKMQRIKNEFIKLQMMESYMTNRGLTYNEILICVLDALFDAGTASLLTVTIIHGGNAILARIDSYIRQKAGEVADTVVETAQIVGESVVDVAETVRNNSDIVDEGATLISNVVSTGDWVIGRVFGSINYIFDYGGKAQNGKVSCPFCEESEFIEIVTDITHVTDIITITREEDDVKAEPFLLSQWLYNELTSIPGLVLCVIFLWKLKIYYVKEREKKEKLRTSVVFTKKSICKNTKKSPKKELPITQQIISNFI